MPQHRATPCQAFACLAGRNSLLGSLLPGMVFLEYLSDCPALASAIGEIRAWNDTLN
ncbi:hypothetical protein ACIRRI_31090 [Streptomyces mirabilis]|uniref:hypothetical protein n=1 Tax=Streptomyces mirabilis TaxID=68239 RepID=UPI00382CB64E